MSRSGIRDQFQILVRASLASGWTQMTGFNPGEEAGGEGRDYTRRPISVRHYRPDQQEIPCLLLLSPVGCTGGSHCIADNAVPCLRIEMGVEMDEVRCRCGAIERY